MNSTTSPFLAPSKTSTRHKHKVKGHQRPLSAFLLPSTHEDRPYTCPSTVTPFYGSPPRNSVSLGLDCRETLPSFNSASGPPLRRSSSISSCRSSLFLPLNSTNQKTASPRRRRPLSFAPPTDRDFCYGIPPASPPPTNHNSPFSPSSTNHRNRFSPSSTNQRNRFSPSPSVSPMSPNLDVTDPGRHDAPHEYSPFQAFSCSPMTSPSTPESAEVVSMSSCSSSSSSPGSCTTHRFFPKCPKNGGRHNSNICGSTSSESLDETMFKEPMHEMLHVARECSNRDAGHLLTFGEFCLYTTELQRCYSREIPRPPILSKLACDNKEKKRTERKFAKNYPKYEVFLGGSCNPTTWRKDIAMPTLTNQGISFYNPQVAHWHEALVELESQAKTSAAVLFFVLDSRTRNVASMVEVGYVSGSQPEKLVLVADVYTPGQRICDDVVSNDEYEELTSGLNMVQDLVQRQGVPVFSEINHALNCTAKILRDNILPQDLSLDDQVQPVRNPQLPLGDKLIKLHDAFVNASSNQISLAEAQVAYKVVTNKELTTEELQAIVASKKGVDMEDLNGSELPLQEVTLSFEEFCCIVAEFKNQKLEGRKLWDILAHSFKMPLQKVISGWSRPVRSPSNSAHDIYLGGSIGDNITWRDEIAIPLLRKSGISFFSPPSSSGRLLPMEAAHLDYSRVLLFVITNNVRGISAMSLAAHYIGLECNVVLCIQMLTERTVINDEELSPAAIKDFNRGRSYLREQANKDRIPVFENIQEAVECAIEKCRALR